jgi:putative ubiquitin-RnfH superfamily antitoxin RatB of RatAB toxin-antitoxin module
MEDFEDSGQTIPVEVAYATPEKQLILSLEVAPGTTAYEAVLLSGITDEFSGIDPDTDPMGIFSKLLDGKTKPEPREYRLQARDRVEIYRPLTIDPKQARIKRAEKVKKTKAKKKPKKKRSK